MNPHNNLSHTTDGGFFRPPTHVTVEGVRYPIRWDFETAFLFMEYVDTSEDSDEVFLDTVLALWYPQIPENKDKAMEEVLKFYCGGVLPKNGYYEPVAEGTPPRERLYFDFIKYYGIDLNREHLHWWVFRRLWEGLRERSGA